MTRTARIILADDDPIMRELSAAKLTEAGYAVTAAADGSEALEALKTHGADLVISDLDMPVMDGFELTKNIRSDQTISQVPVIVVTASDHADAVDSAFAAGATSFLAKPINWTLFSQAVMFVLRASENQRALMLARDQAEAGAKFKDSLMSVMSHELRTPLNAIIGFGQLIAQKFDEQKDDLHKEYAEYIIDGGKRLLNSVSDMLLASEARSGEVVLNEIDTTIEDIISHATSLNEKSASAAGADIVVKLEQPDVEVCCDGSLLSRALGKLIENSVKFCPKDAKVIVATAATKSGGIAILIKDNGPGLSEARLSEVCAPFSQSDMSTRRSKEGLGLGIPLSKAIAEAHGAKFKMDSVEGEGLRTLVILPASRVHHARAGRSNVA